MSHTPHDLHAEFPEHGDVLHRLKLEDRHFQTLSERYHDLNREIHRVETGVEAGSDDRLEELKKQRLAMLDEVRGMISKADA
jgi:uncharacterized protein YdcH (DUF465 family)